MRSKWGAEGPASSPKQGLGFWVFRGWAQQHTTTQNNNTTQQQHNNTTQQQHNTTTTTQTTNNTTTQQLQHQKILAKTLKTLKLAKVGLAKVGQHSKTLKIGQKSVCQSRSRPRLAKSRSKNWPKSGLAKVGLAKVGHDRVALQAARRAKETTYPEPSGEGGEGPPGCLGS